MTDYSSQPIFRTRNNESMRKCKQSKFSIEEDDIIMQMVNEFNNLGQKVHWSVIAAKLSNKNGSDVSHRWNSVLNPALKKGSWTPDEDLAIINWVKLNGPAKWSLLQRTHLPHRCGKQLRERWVNILSPSIQIHGASTVESMLNKNINGQNDEESQNFEKIKKKNHLNINSNNKKKVNKDLISSSQPISNSQWTQEDDDLIYQLFQLYGPKWKKIASMFNGRSENSIKNRWHSIKNQKSRILEGKDPLMKRGPKKKTTESIDRSLLMMKDNEQKLSAIDPAIITEGKNSIWDISFFDELDMCSKDNMSNNKCLSLFSPTSISILPSPKDFEISLENYPVTPPLHTILNYNA